MNHINPLASGRCGNTFKIVIPRHVLWFKFISFLVSCSQLNAIDHLWWYVNKPSADPMLNQGPFSISSVEVQVTRNFSSKSFDCFLSSLLVTWKPSHLRKSHVTSVADLEISWVALTSLFVICIYLNQYMWHYMVCFTTYLQKAVRILFTDKLGARCHQLRKHHRHRRLQGCWIKWRHNSVDAWHHNSVDADAWWQQQCIARKTIGCVPK